MKRFQQLKNDFHFKLSNQQLASIGGVLCLGTVALVAYKYWFSGKKAKTPNTPVEEEKSFQQIYRQVIKNVQQCINKYQSLNGEVIKCILKNQYKLAQNEYKAFIFKVRNQRRKVMKDKHQYRQLILSIDAANEELMDRNLNAILAHFNIQKTNWIQNVELWSSDTEENKEEWENLLIDLDNELLDSLRSKTKALMSCKKLQQILKFKIHSLNHLSESGLDLDISTTSDDEPDLNAKYTLIDKYIQDLLFNKFGVQEEDIVYSENQLSKEDQDKVYAIEDEFTELIRVTIYGDENSDEDDVEDGLEADMESQEVGDEEEVLEAEEEAQEADGAQSAESQRKKDWKDHEEEQQDEGQYF